ncbi:ribbon-helix-helix domain-containing protein [Granulicella tundricola]|uniref:Ribbon-helix-helix protein CopG domain-containing protein n=1 Tax=Granulicella tundricola (strain ATCC BAA-1859 / DSM 23138 / MP5ACTX9) TaxID=1198114 RepID=E8X229_GRATM|nr:ribbon-helix-helix protein, CopG family [Granulicella tundricola]ADW70272.1 hypothetical protein AciX9_3261 [Granulicella tundricola MP5ACTX9]
MAINLPAELEQSVDQLAARHGFTKDDFIRDAVEQRVAQYEEEPELTEAQLAHLDEGVAQLRRGEFVPGEVIEAKLEKLLEELEARAKIEEQSASVATR